MKTPSKFKVENAWVCKIEGQNIKPVFGNLNIKDGIIESFEARNFNDYLKSPKKKNSQNYDAKGSLVTVPLVNFHEHFYSRLAKGFAPKGPMDNFYNILHNLWWKLDKALDLKMVEASAAMGSIEAIKNGVTYIFDHHASPKNIRGSLDVIADVLKNQGLRGVLCFEVSDRNGVTTAEKSLEENRSFFFRHESDEDIKAMMGLHASFTLSDDSLAEASDFVNKYGLGIHIHLCEDPIDRSLSKEITNAYPVRRLVNYKLLNVKSILAHGIYLTKKDYEIIDKNGSALVYNPDSNLNNSVGIPNFAYVPESIPLLMGTDGMHGNPGKSLKNIFLLMRASGYSFDEAFRLIRETYFDQLTFVKRYFPDFPRLQVGDRADFVVWDYFPPAPINKNNFWGHYIYGLLERRPLSVIQNGKFLLQNGKLTGVNEEEINKIIYSEGKRLKNKFTKL